MADPTTNFAVGTVLTAPSPATSGTSLVLASGQGARFPTTADGDFNVVLVPQGTAPEDYYSTAEIVTVTARSTDTLTIVRARESTSAKSVATGWYVFLAPTARFAKQLTSGVRVVMPGDSIQDAIDVGPGLVLLGAGTHNVTTPILVRKDVTLAGTGGGTRLVATASISTVIDVVDVDAIRFTIKDMVVDANGNAGYGINVRVNYTGTSVDGEPDCMGRLDNLWVYDATDIGIRYGDTNGDVQNMITTRCRVRRAGNYAFWIGDSANVGAPDSMWAFCDGTTQNTGTFAAWYIGSANCHFVACKAWYSRGYGFWVKATRCTFTGCESQDTRLHGWFIEWDKNQFVNCVADSSSYYDVGGTLNGADGFYLATGLTKTSLIGCAAFNRSTSGSNAQQRYGFNIPNAMNAYIDASRPGLGSMVMGLTGYDNATALFNWR